jgi:murein DD-endopeptidase MepM/ murein hydrolase activator NlpD
MGMGMAVAHLGAATPDEDLNRLVRLYSTQQIVGLDVDETFPFKLKSGAERVIRLVSLREHRDSVIHLVRRADVRVQIDGHAVDLVCAPYVMPTETAGLRIQADTTSGWVKIPKKVQFSAWDANEPIVDTKRFGFPIRNYRLFSHGTQAFNEPVHLGAGDGDPAGQRFYHNYGFDQAGFEGREEVVCAAEGKVVAFWPSREDLCSVLVQDRNGLVWEYGHLCAAAAKIVLGAPVTQGQKIGILGRTGPSGNFSHLHLGMYLSRDHMGADKPSRRLNLYPWVVAAYRAQHPKGLFAVARPHQACLLGRRSHGSRQGQVVGAHLLWIAGQLLGAAPDDPNRRQPELPHDVLEERCLLAGGFHQGKREVGPHELQGQPGKTRSRPDIQGAPGVGGNEGQAGQRVEESRSNDILRLAERSQVHPRRPAGDLLEVGAEGRHLARRKVEAQSEGASDQ